MLLVVPPSKAGQFDTHTFQAADHNEIKDWWIDQGGSIDSYFYSENSTTGSDGVLGNEYICLRDDVNKVYVGRSDVCVNRELDSTYSYIQIDEIDWDTQEYIVGQTGDLIGDTSKYWSGCYELNRGWAGTSGGSCPALNDFGNGQINFGYIERTLTNLAAINIALEQAGIEATGYNYSWSVKNWDANYKDQGNGRGTADPLQVEVVVRDTENNVVFSKTYDYSGYISQWTTFAGEETFANPFDVNTLSEIELSVTGRDLGYWAGYYGPEFANPSIKLNYRYTGNPVAEESLEDTVLLSAQCSADPLFSPECPGYNDAMIAQIAPQQDLFSDTQDFTGTPDTSGTASDTGETNDGTMDSTTTGMVGMDSSSSSPGSDVQETQTASTGVEASTGDVASSTEATSPGSGRSLNANELNALSAAENVASAATSIAADSSTQSLTSSSTSMDSIGSTNMGGFDTNGVAGSSSFGGGAGTSSFSSDTASTGMDSNMGNTGMDSNMEDSASIDLAQGGSVQTEDITGEAALSASEQLTQGANMADIELASLDLDLIRDIVNGVAERTLQDIKDEQEESMEEANEASIAEANAEEDRLAQEAMAGSTDESALVALLGYNPNFRAYQQPQITDGELYPPKDIYTDKKNYDNPAARFFNGASDEKHRQMVRGQYQ